MKNTRTVVSVQTVFREVRLFSLRSWMAIWRGVWAYFWAGKRWARVQRWRLYFFLKIEGVVRAHGRVGEWTEGRLKVLVDGREFFPRLAHLLHRARRSIVIQMFSWRDDPLGRHIVRLLVEAADRGVMVDITKETAGDSFELSRDFYSTRENSRGVWQRFWHHPNITVHHEARNDHTKAFVIDDRLLLGGMNIGEEYQSDWHDYFVELRSRRFAEGYLAEQDVFSPRGSVRLVMNATRRGNVRAVFVGLIRSARKRILLEQSYFSDPAIADLLAERSREGLMVTLIVPAKGDVHSFANKDAIRRLLVRGDPRRIRVLLYPRMLHGKLALVDRRRIFIGSANVLTSSLDWMGEANILIERGHPNVLRKLRRVIREDIAQSTLLDKPPYLGVIGKLFAWVGL
ncbi:MAG: phosphatidylserine/phosphatidylglycerophosphate/cardiolipin synthase family protein [Candidatus Peribacteraceae bacterium]|nr:phosphatidylserine/phosphatidylglycerophosphate/cardiolipin synthase family protein [Candidatus Peribacteraceae bacterium]